MNALPLELREIICSYLFPPIDRVNAASAPTSSEVERTAIYNLRLTSQRMKDATSFVFLKVIQDVPRQCTETSLYNLWNLIHLTSGGSRITSLTFSSCKLNFTERMTWKEVHEFAARRRGFIEQSLAHYLGFIFAVTPRLRHLVCCFEAVRGSDAPELGDSHYKLTRIADEEIPDPMQYVFEALQRARLHKKIETLGIFIISRECFPKKTSISQREYFSLPSLKHMTLSPTYHNHSTVLIYCGKATSLNIVLDHLSRNRAFIPTHLRPSVMANASRVNMGNHRLSDAEATAIQRRRKYTITGNGRRIPSDVLAALMNTLFEHESTIRSLKICNMNITAYEHDGYPPFEDKKILRLTTQDVVYSPPPEFGFPRYANPLIKGSGGKAFINMCRCARQVRISYTRRLKETTDKEWLY